MKRDDLLKKLSSLPADAEIGVRFGDASLDISEISEWGQGQFVALECHPGDVHDVLREWGIPLSRGDSTSPSTVDGA